MAGAVATILLVQRSEPNGVVGVDAGHALRKANRLKLDADGCAEAALCSCADTVAREGEHGVFRPQQRLGAGSNQGEFVDDCLVLRSVAPDADVLPCFGLQSRFRPSRLDRPDRTWDAGRP